MLNAPQELEDIICNLMKEFSGITTDEQEQRAEALRRIASPYACAEAAGFPDKIFFEERFINYINSKGVKESILRWVFSEYNPMRNCIPGNIDGFEEWLELSLLEYCAEGNLYSVLKEWIFVNGGKIPSNEDLNNTFNFTGSTVYYQTFSSMFQVDDQRHLQKNIKDGKEQLRKIKCRYSERLTGDIDDNGTGKNGDDERQNMAKRFSTPFWPMMLSVGRGAQEGMDFHQYCMKLAHLTIPKGAVSMEQRQGRIDRFRSLLIRRRAAEYASECIFDTRMDILTDLFNALEIEKKNLNMDNNEIFPNWSMPILKGKETEFFFYKIVPFWRFTEEAKEYSSCVNQAINYRVGFGATYSDKLNEKLGKLTPEERDSIMINLAADPE